MNCDLLLKATKVDGVYSADPVENKDAERYDSLSYHDVLARDLKVMDAGNFPGAENSIPIVVFSIYDRGAFAGVIKGRPTHIIDHGG